MKRIVPAACLAIATVGLVGCSSSSSSSPAVPSETSSVAVPSATDAGSSTPDASESATPTDQPTWSWHSRIPNARSLVIPGDQHMLFHGMTYTIDKSWDFNEGRYLLLFGSPGADRDDQLHAVVYLDSGIMSDPQSIQASCVDDLKQFSVSDWIVNPTVTRVTVSGLHGYRCSKDITKNDETVRTVSTVTIGPTPDDRGYGIVHQTVVIPMKPHGTDPRRLAQLDTSFADLNAEVASWLKTR